MNRLGFGSFWLRKKVLMRGDELIGEKIIRLLEEASQTGRPLDVDKVANQIATLVDLPPPVVVLHVNAIAKRLGLTGDRH